MMPSESVFDSPALLAFMATAYVKREGDVTLYLSERRLIENAQVAPPDGEYKRASDQYPNG
jgi:hypothetical protein